MRTIDWNDESKSVVMIDQTLLPVELNVIECKNLASLCEAIRSLRVRGAPALAAAGGFGMALAVTLSSADSMEKLLNDLKVAASTLIATRPTAVNLAWAVNRVLKATEDSYDLESIKDIVVFEAIRIADEDVEINKAIGKYGQKLLDDGDTVMTHCNAGRMACVDWGTALGVIRSAVEKGKEISVIACETRPLNQGGRITTWELMQDKIPVKLITDSMSGHVMRHGMVDKMIVGADRITQDVVFNKIGTYTHSIVAREHEIPFYVAAPVSTFDPNGWEDTVTIEQRDADELRYIGDVQIAPKNVDVYNPAFDATPMENITALITEKGIFEPPVLIDEILM
ncbi:S-methyl-5-thioribose-1-phosphate isomerase [Methanococcoides alaskense]|uniref:Putative methylthioribose-1-phosphate isomerase n=1 Tax=Methanococcoides alaskense TaxID=325778 RepID=A0AA90TYI1_9EURY|nr:S-methyl-5-thioribose-1-phosphate isomerase [Methanococcoides alaskense]MDA0524063.1 S-methyl-5-thioribose-1-phosphate isomerase [Methanococcoides alaskense]MDR6222513.1 methylthioribose-1-phosphate isomerase [Methanococcoides alaskense]